MQIFILIDIVIILPNQV